MTDPLRLFPFEVALQCLLYSANNISQIMRVCKHWHLLADSPLVWKAILMQDTRFSMSSHKSNSATFYMHMLASLTSKSDEESSQHIQRLRPTKLLFVPPKRLEPVFACDTMEDASIWDDCNNNGSKDYKSVNILDLVTSPKEFVKSLCTLSVVCALRPTPLIQCGVSASSTDQESQDIECTLDELSHTFWSSTGSENPLSNEYLIYKLKQPSIITGFEIKPFKANFQRGTPTYAPRFVSISVGFTENPMEMHYASPLYPVENENRTQSFNLAPTLVYGRFVRIHLHGRVSRQPTDEMLYTVLESVNCFGAQFGVTGETGVAGYNQCLLETLVDIGTRLGCDWREVILDTRVVSNEFTNELTDELEAGDSMPLLCDPPTRTGITSALCSQVLRNSSEEMAETVLLGTFYEQMRNGKWSDAADLIAQRPISSLFRQPNFLKTYFLSASNVHMGNTENPSLPLEKLINLYLCQLIYHRGRFSNYEALKLVDCCRNSRSLKMFFEAATRQLLVASEELGDALRSLDEKVALQIYTAVHSFEKAVDVLLALKRFDRALWTANMAFGTDIDLCALVRRVFELHSRPVGLEFAIIVCRDHPNASDQVRLVVDSKLPEHMTSAEFIAWMSSQILT
ncbi:hypothetical protein BASA61_000275 [Batrachochytrium salamandrivorans]|nr:hypothetical protein BASA61_000275 [Batrachochytrium salamandrivorans]KAH9268800.1 hypothetical protein BASA84_000031 [Batrachochytrium salamandrivorans]KAJ1343194.1 hypothetical protein BSLG_002220 [Batrachochytrium salamandrivorans]